MRQCYFCTNNINSIDYKKTDILRRFTDIHARISPKRETGLCAKHQRKLSVAIKRARIMALLPFVAS